MLFYFHVRCFSLKYSVTKKRNAVKYGFIRFQKELDHFNVYGGSGAAGKFLKKNKNLKKNTPKKLNSSVTGNIKKTKIRLTALANCVKKKKNAICFIVPRTCLLTTDDKSGLLRICSHFTKCVLVMFQLGGEIGFETTQCTFFCCCASQEEKPQNQKTPKQL